MNEIKEIKISAISVPEQRMRAFHPEQIDALMESMTERGLLQPIILRPLAARKFMLVAGRHRLEAARKLGWSEINAHVLKGIDLIQAQLTEIDENLIRFDLSLPERALHHAKRKELYLQKNPMTKRGAAGGAATKAKHEGRAKPQTAEQPSYVAKTAVDLGASKASVDRDIRRGEKIDGDVLIKIIGTSLASSEEMDALAKLSFDEQRVLADRAAEGQPVSARGQIKRARRAAREAELGAKQTAMPTKKYGVIYADPPWKFETWSDDGKDRAPENHYPTMSEMELRKLKIPAAKDCVLFMWATTPMLPTCLDVLGAWGFVYVTHCIWVKDKSGTGYWFRNTHEVLLLGTRGEIPAPAPGEQYNSIIEAPRGKHSEKPVIFREMIEKMFPSLPKLEMFARGKAAAGWDVWGNEAIMEAAE